MVTRRLRTTSLILFFGSQACACNSLFGIEPPERQFSNMDGSAGVSDSDTVENDASPLPQRDDTLGTEPASGSTSGDPEKLDAASTANDASVPPVTDSTSDGTNTPSLDASTTPPMRTPTDPDASLVADGVGQPCGSDGQCVEGRCQAALDGAMICCAASCDSACKSCSTDGASCVDEVDDPACGVITCPADDVCRKYSTQSIATERCVDGTCGAPEALCSFTARGESKGCSATHMCDAFGNCSVPKLALGATCDGPDQCTDGYCVDGVCCEGHCDGPCMQCRAGTGLCDVIPADDSMCSDVICENLTTECATSVGDITANHCKALGACRTFTDCETIAQPKGTPCGGYPRICDGVSECVDPEVDCGASSCEIFGENRCCAVSSDESVSAPQCMAEGEQCLAGYSDWELRCDEQSDCRSGEEICCAIVTNSGGGRLQCVPPQECNLYAEIPGASFVELCESQRMERRACSNGVACSITSETLPGFTFCRLP